MKRLSLVCFTGFWVAISGAQNDSSLPVKVSSNIKIAYNASILYPGYRFGVEYPVKQAETTKYRSQKTVRHFTIKQYLSAETGYYHHPAFHDNLYVLFGWHWRKQRPRGFFTEWSPALGYSRTFLGGETYLVEESGIVRKVRFAGYDYALVAVGGGIGYTFNPKMALYMRTSVLTMFPSVNLVYVRPTVDLGLVWQPNHFWERSLRIVSNTKGKKNT